ncbi:MAG: hypothetical protein KDA85_12390, partial [Planctomycetaceae bacterium]|nr:hypothetical protein [Planctomycetaceae bacterium]
MLTIMRWQSRQLLPTTILFAFLAACWTLFCSDVLQPLLTPYVAPAVILHGVLMCWQLGRNSPRHSGFLYIQGFSRDQIWWGTVTATLAAAALVSLTVWLFITTHTRSAVQAALGNPWFPAAGSSDADCVFALFALYVIVLGIGH